VFLRRRLRRTLSPGLLLATAVLAATVAYCGARAADDRFGGEPDYLLGLATRSAVSEAAAGQRLETLGGVLAQLCTQYCGRTLALPAGAAPGLGMHPDPPPGVPARTADEVTKLTTPPRDGVALVLIPVAALAVAGLGWVGFLGPVTEYRFQQR
jgi:hypothetical protein